MGLLWLKHISRSFEPQPLGSVNPQLQRRTTPVTLLVTCHNSKFEGAFGVDRFGRIDWCEVRGDVCRRGRSKQNSAGGYETYFGCCMT